MDFAERNQLQGHVEVDEVFLGGVSHGKRGRENKQLIVIVVERSGNKKLGKLEFRD